MWTIEVTKAKSRLTKEEPLLTSGSVNAFQVEFKFDSEWDGLDKFATFRLQGKSDIYEIWMATSNVVDIPWELLTQAGGTLQVGAYGINDEGERVIRLPTTWLRVMDISQGVLDGKEVEEPTPDIYEQFIESVKSRGNSLKYEGSTLSLMSDNEVLASVDVVSGTQAVSPVIDITPIADGYTLTITDVNGTQSVNIMNGDQGPKGEPGDGAITWLSRIRYRWSDTALCEFDSYDEPVQIVGPEPKIGNMFYATYLDEINNLAYNLRLGVFTFITVPEFDGINWSSFRAELKYSILLGPARGFSEGRLLFFALDALPDLNTQASISIDAIVGPIPMWTGGPGEYGFIIVNDEFYKVKYRFESFDLDSRTAIATFYKIDAMGSRGIPAGGTKGQVLAKSSGTDYDVGWVDQNGGSGGGSSGEIYSTEETRIGTWIDGKPLYRVMVNTSTGSVENNVNIIGDVSSGTDVVTKIFGMAIIGESSYVIPCSAIDIGVDNNKIISVPRYRGWTNNQVTLFIEYTKIID